MTSTRIYLLTLNSPSQRALRLWTGKSLHRLRHCSVEEIGHALVEMQQHVEDLQKDMGTLQRVKEQLVSVSAGGREHVKMGNGLGKTATRFDHHDKGRTSKGVKKATIDQELRRVPVFRNIGQKGNSRGRSKG